MNDTTDFARLLDTLRSTLGPMSSQEAFALALPDVVELTADEYSDGLELAISVGVFSRIAPFDLQKILHLSREIPVQAGEVLFEQGGAARRCYLIKNGSLTESITGADGAADTATLRRPGELVGAESLLLGGPATASVVVREDSKLLEIGAEEFHALVAAALVRPVALDEVEPLITAGAQWLDLRPRDPEHPDGVLHLSLPRVREECARLEETHAWIVRAASPAEAAVGTFLLAARGFEAYQCVAPAEEAPVLVAPPVALEPPALRKEAATKPGRVPAAEVLDADLPLFEATTRMSPVPEIDLALAVTEDEEATRIGLEDIRSFERHRYENQLRKTLTRLQEEADARVAQAVDQAKRSLIQEVEKRQRRLMELRHENASLKRELMQVRQRSSRPHLDRWAGSRMTDMI